MLLKGPCAATLVVNMEKSPCCATGTGDNEVTPWQSFKGASKNLAFNEEPIPTELELTIGCLKSPPPTSFNCCAIRLGYEFTWASAYKALSAYPDVIEFPIETNLVTSRFPF